MIEHPVLRTRALYAWEEYDLEKRRGVRPLECVRECRDVVESLWGVRRERPAVVTIRKLDGSPYCEGRSLIVLTHKSRLNVTLLHEITHAHGYGSFRNPHNREFTRAYIRLLARFFKWDDGELTCQAIMRGLL